MEINTPLVVIVCFSYRFAVYYDDDEDTNKVNNNVNKMNIILQESLSFFWRPIIFRLLLKIYANFFRCFGINGFKVQLS